MALIDNYQQQTLSQILKQEWEVDNRAIWEDGTPIATKRIFGVVNRYDLSKQFPASTLRPTPLKSCFDETDWIYRKRSNNIHDFKGKIWNQWADENGSIGEAYGAQIAKPILGYDNQMDYILEEIKRNPSSRRLVMEMWNVDDLSKMNLPPCAHHLQFQVQHGRVNLILKQRSQDFIVANSWNVCQYALLVHMVARHCALEAGQLLHIIGDCHIYNKHEEQALELMSRNPLPAPIFLVNPEVTNFYDFTEDDFMLLNYQTHPQIKGIEVAV